MQISPVNNTNFNGTIKPSPLLNEIRSYASKDSIARFDAMSEKIAKIDDGFIFDFSKRVKYNMNKNEVAQIFRYDIYRTNRDNTESKKVYTIEENINTYSTPESIKERKAIILDVITDFFENIFYKPEESKYPEILKLLKNTK